MTTATDILEAATAQSRYTAEVMEVQAGGNDTDFAGFAVSDGARSVNVMVRYNPHVPAPVLASDLLALIDTYFEV